MQCSAFKASMINGGSSSTISQSHSATRPGVGRRIRVNAVRFTALVPALRLTPSSFPSLSITAIPVRVSLKRIKYTFAAPAQATANQGMHYAQRPNECEPCPADHRLRDAGPACCQPEPHSQTRSWPSSTPSRCPLRWTPSTCCGCCSWKWRCRTGWPTATGSRWRSAHQWEKQKTTVGGANSIPIWIGMLAGTKQDIRPIGLMICFVWGCSIDSMMFRAFHSSSLLYLFSPRFQDSIFSTASSWAFLPKMTFLDNRFDPKNLPEVAADHVILYTTPIGRFIIQPLIYA